VIPVEERVVTGNSTALHRNVAVLSLATSLPGLVTTSEQIDERLSDVLERLRLPTGLLQRVAGISAKRHWAPGQTFDGAAVEAGDKALAEAGVDRGAVDLLINTSVTRTHLEPSVAVRIHHGLGLPTSAVNFDLANACLGFVNGMTLAAHLIDAGQVRYAMVVDGEDAAGIEAATIERLHREGLTRDDFMTEFASLTLGSGAAAAVLGPADRHPAGHRVLGGVTRAATQFHDACVGGVEGMLTDTRALLEGGMELVVAAWEEARADWDWQAMDRYVVHQVSHVHTAAVVAAIGIDRDRIPVTYPVLGNVGPASLPITLAEQAGSLAPGDRVLLMGVGSGLNTTMTEILW